VLAPELGNIAWRKSSYSGQAGDCVEVANLAWHKSSHSGEQGDCVEVANLANTTAVRDSKATHGPALTFADAAWATFIADVKHTT
jgi:hypothetical protein